MFSFFSQYWSEILLTIVSGGAVAICKNFWSKIQAYRKIIEEKEAANVDQNIDEHLEPIIEEIENLREYIRKVDEDDDAKIELVNSKIKLIVDSYRFRLIQLCRIYLKRGYITHDQYEQLSEFYSMYSKLGGNGQAKEYYNKVLTLELRDEDI